MKVSFDFDGTLEFPVIQEYAKHLINNGIDVIICTSRYEPGYKHSWGGVEWRNDDIFNVADKLGINNIIFTNMKDKWLVLKDKDITWHLDDDNIEINIMNEQSNIKGILFDEKWKEKCNKTLFSKKYKK